MKKIFRIALAIALTAELVGCQYQRPDQDNFLVDARTIGGMGLARELSSHMNAKLTTGVYSPPNSDSAQMFRLDGEDFMLVVTPVADDRCDPKKFRDTFTEKEFRLDLVYKSEDSESKKEIKHRLLGIIEKLPVRVQQFKECS